MAPDQDLQAGTEQSDIPAAAETPRPGRRSGRGHRGRRRRSRAPRSEQASSTQPTSLAQRESVAAESELPRESDKRAEVAAVEPERTPFAEAPARPVGHARPAQPASKVSIQAAIEQVNDIISVLKESLEQMDEVLESLEYFERQGDADEREIESLRRSLRQLQRSREGGQHPHRGHS